MSLGIIAGALGGLGQGAQVVGQNLQASAMQDQQFANQKDLVQLQSQLALDKEKAIEQFRAQLGVDTANSQRQAMVDRIGAAKTGIIGQALATKYGQSDAAVADADAGNTDAPLTDEQKAAIAQAKQLDADRLANDGDVATRAAIATGDIDPAKAATLASQKDIAQLRQENFKDRTDAMVQMREIAARAQIDAANIRAQAAEEKAKNGGVSASMRTMLINSENANIKASTSEMSMLSRQLADYSAKDPRRAQINDRIEELRDEIKQAQANKNTYMQDLGIIKPDGKGGKDDKPGAANPATDPLGLFPKKK
jgi:hypothetical protein